MDIVIASRHGGSFSCDETNYAQPLLNACENKYIDIFGHIARTSFSLKDEEYNMIAKKAKEKGKLIELNENCFVKNVEIGWDKVPELTIEMTDSSAAGKRLQANTPPGEIPDAVKRRPHHMGV